MRWVLACFALCSLMLVTSAGSLSHSNNWAIIVSTSRYWFNYRHMANALSLYRTVKQLGIPDSQIILMLPDDMACNPRNSFAGQIFNNRARTLNLYSDDVQVDYRGLEVSVESFLRLLTGRHESAVPRSKRLLSDEHSNLLIYMTGHGGDEFLKFNDQEEISSVDLADAFSQMHRQKRYNEILFMVDTCQAGTLHRRISAPNVIAIGSSRLGENSYSHHADNEVGISVIDRFTYATLEFFERRAGKPAAESTVGELFAHYDHSELMSHADFRTDLAARPITKIPLTDFFGAVTDVVAVPTAFNLSLSDAQRQHTAAAAAASPGQQETSATRTAADTLLLRAAHGAFLPAERPSPLAATLSGFSDVVSATLAAVFAAPPRGDVSGSTLAFSTQGASAPPVAAAGRSWCQGGAQCWLCALGAVTLAALVLDSLLARLGRLPAAAGSTGAVSRASAAR